MLTSKQKAKIKSVAMGESSIFQVGKNNLNENLIEGLNQALEKREIIKINILKSSELSKEEVANIIAKETKSSLVEIKGQTVVLYKKSKKDLYQI